MAINLIEAWDINLAVVKVKFEPSIKISTITNNRFSLLTDAATPAVVSANPFEAINIEEDYDSIGKILVLRWNSDILVAETAYRLKISGLRNPSNVLIDDDYIFFETDENATPNQEDIPIPLPVYIVEDFSIIPDPVVVPNEEVEDDLATFKILETDPLNNDAFLPEDYNSGVLIIKFNILPDPAFLTNEYFIAQRKEIKRLPSRWESVAIEIEAHPTQTWVIVRFPSNDATPVYDEADASYFEKNYKYRVKVSGEVGY